MKNYKLFIDDSHAWLQVPINDILDYGIKDIISKYSYIDIHNKFCYLEEDTDLHKFVNAYIDRHSINPTIVALTIDGQSAIRNFSSYEVSKLNILK